MVDFPWLFFLQVNRIKSQVIELLIITTRDENVPKKGVLVTAGKVMKNRFSHEALYFFF